MASVPERLQSSLLLAVRALRSVVGLTNDEAQRSSTQYRAWWKEAVVYQVYWRRFSDINSDGIGDVKGIMGKLDYLRDLGVNVIWLAPMYPSPMVDGGYDVSDYKGIHPAFGTLGDFIDLVSEARSRDIRIMMDMVFNHLSDQHRWFRTALEPDDPEGYRDYFIWRDGVPNTLPDMTQSMFTGSAWRWVPEVQKYVLHTFAYEQIDLNWENPRVRDAVIDVLKYWRNLGVGGFRFDVIDMVDKKPRRPRLLEWLNHLKKEVPFGEDIITVGEMPTVTMQQARLWTHSETGCLNMVFHFDTPSLLYGKGASDDPVSVPGNIPMFTGAFTRWQKALAQKGWNSIYLGNHDWPRIVSRYGNDTLYPSESAKLFATLQFTLQGTPYVYQGEELGLANAVYDTIEEYEDIATQNRYREAVQRGESPASALLHAQEHSRDASRGSVPWDIANAQEEDPKSVLSFYKQLINWRKEEPTFVYGVFERQAAASTLSVYTRKLKGTTVLVVLNLSELTVEHTVKKPWLQKGELIIHNYADPLPRYGTIPTRPYEARVYRFTR